MMAEWIRQFNRKSTVEIATDRHFDYAGKPDSRPIYQMKIPADTRANNSCLIRAIVKGGGGVDSKGTVGILSGKP